MKKSFVDLVKQMPVCLKCLLFTIISALLGAMCAGAYNYDIAFIFSIVFCISVVFTVVFMYEDMTSGQ